MEPSFQCPRCNIIKPTHQKLLKHQQIYHENEAGFTIVCGVEDCPRVYATVKSLQNHIRKKHSQQLQELETIPDASVCEPIESPEWTETSRPQSTLDIINNFTETLKRQLALFSLKLQEQNVVQKKVQTIVVNEIELLFKYFTDNYKQLFCQYLQRLNVSCPEFSLIEDNDLLDYCFSVVNSSYQLEKYCVEKLNLIEPVEYLLGIDSYTGKKDTFQYIQILKVLSLVCNDETTLQHIFRPDTQATDGLTDFRDGKIFQENCFFNTSEPCLRIQLYNDEFEVANPLGSKRLLHKISAFYFSIGNLPAKYRSALRHIHLLILVKHRLVKTYGFEKILEPLIFDLQKLQSDGIELCFEGRTYNIKGGLATISADNLSSHALGGFSCSFSNGRVCRFCMCHYEDLSDTISEEDCTLRTKTTHSHHLECVKADPKSKSVYGVNGPCPFSHLKYFETTQAFPPDVMHDFLEGIAPLVLKSLLKALHKLKTVNIQEVNVILKKFSFGRNDCSSKPSVIPEKVVLDQNISGTAVQKWTLFRTLPFLIGHKVEEGNKFWQLYLLAREIGEVILAPTISIYWLSHLDSLINQFLTGFNDLFPGSFTPKLHFLLHYPRLILEYGPPRSHWCMRYEAKHLYFKRVARVTNNFMNIAQTLAKRNQLRQCWDWQSQSVSDNTQDNKQAAASESSLQELPLHVQAHLQVLDISVGEKIWKSKLIFVNSITYAVGDYFILDLVHEEQIPLFVKITLILNIRANWLLVGNLHTTVAFLSHLHAYHIEDTGDSLLLKPGDEVDSHPLDMYRCDGKDLVTLIHRPFKEV